MRNSQRNLGVLGVSAVFLLAPDALKEHAKKIIGLVAALLRCAPLYSKFASSLFEKVVRVKAPGRKEINVI